jgi:hypothetical protein
VSYRARQHADVFLGGTILLIVAGCGASLPPPGPGSRVDMPGYLLGPGFAEDPACVPFGEQNNMYPRTWDLVVLPDGISYDPRFGLVKTDAEMLEVGRIVLSNGGRARVVGTVARDGRDTCPGTPLVVELIEPLPPDPGGP